MFIGHYGPSFAAKALKQRIPLWLLFLVVQLLDVFWSIFVLLGIEKVRIVPGITATNPLDLYYMPYTHSLDGAAAWAIAAGVVYWLFRKADGWQSAAIVSAAVFSHWVLDLIVHRPDLPLYDESMKVGLGLWNHPIAAFALEIAFLFGGMYLYWTMTEPMTSGGRYGMPIFGVLMVAVQAVVFFGPPPTSDRAGAITALVLYFGLAAVAYWLEKKRVPRTIVKEVESWTLAN
jgi:membrane-bound metal-dependent hydrolase YbcI (DUF457 family)